METFAEPLHPDAVEAYTIDLSPLLQDGELALEATLTPLPAAAEAGLSIRQDGDYAPTLLEGRHLRFFPQIARAEREHARFARYGARLAVRLDFATNAVPERRPVALFALRVRR